MRKVTTLLVTLLLLSAHASFGQETEYLFEVPLSDDVMAAYTSGLSSGARDIFGPVDLDNDGMVEVLVSDYTGGGRVHVIENTGIDSWEWAYSTAWLDSTGSTENIRAIAGGDLDGDGMGEIYFLGGRTYSETNPNISSLPVGLYVFEFNGTDFGDQPTSVYEFDGDLPDRWRAEDIEIADVDGDDVQELLFGNNGADNRYDNWYILSVIGDIGSGFETFVQELRASSRAAEDFDPVNRGGGSPYAIHTADLDGDGTNEVVLHAWNSFALDIAQATGPDQYFTEENFIQATAPSDEVGFFGGTVVDADNNGDDEVYFASLQTGGVLLLNFENGEDPLQIGADNVVVNLIPDFTTLGLMAGDIDSDGNVDLVGSGPSYTAQALASGSDPNYFRVAEFIGGDVEDPSNYQTASFSVFSDFDTMAVSFDMIVRDDSTYFEDGAQGPVFVSKMVFLGDADGDGLNEFAAAFQGVDDSTYVIQETPDGADGFTREVVEARPNEHRVYMRIIEVGARSVAVEPGAGVPAGYTLEANYPNPFNPSTSFYFNLPAETRVSVKVYDVMGRLVRTLASGQSYPQGRHRATWDGRSDTGAQAASGTYFYTLEFDGQRIARSMLLVK